MAVWFFNECILREREKNHMLDIFPVDEWLGISHIGVYACFSPWFESNGFCMSFWIFFSPIIVQYCIFFLFRFVVVPIRWVCSAVPCENYQLAHFGRKFNIHILFGTSHTSAVWLCHCSDISVLVFIMLNIRRGREENLTTTKYLSWGLHTVRFLSFVYLKNPVKNCFFSTLWRFAPWYPNNVLPTCNERVNILMLNANKNNKSFFFINKQHNKCKQFNWKESKWKLFVVTKWIAIIY